MSVTIDEQTSLNPGVSFRTPMRSAITNFKGEYLAPSGSLLSAMTYPLISTPQSYSFGIGGTASSEASVDDSSDFSVLFKPLLTGKNWDDYFRKRSGNQDTSCKNVSNVLIEGDLGLNDWLEDRVLPVMLGNVSAPKTSVQRHLFFKVVTNGNIAPTWTLVRVSTPSTPLASAGRTRTYDLIVTLGPQAKPSGEGQCCKKPKPKGEETFTPTAEQKLTLSSPDRCCCLTFVSTIISWSRLFVLLANSAEIDPSKEIQMAAPTKKATRKGTRKGSKPRAPKPEPRCKDVFFHGQWVRLCKDANGNYTIQEYID